MCTPSRRVSKDVTTTCALTSGQPSARSISSGGIWKSSIRSPWIAIAVHRLEEVGGTLLVQNFFQVVHRPRLQKTAEGADFADTVITAPEHPGPKFYHLGHGRLYSVRT